MKNIYKILIVLAVVAFGVSVYFYSRTSTISTYKFDKPVWPIRSVDTVKYSRDLAREKLNSTTFDTTIESQVKNIKSIGATHIAISTPYDSEFTPFLKRWVYSARRNGLNVWFRGNFSGWEKWFEYPQIDRQKHLEATEQFILNNPDLFEDGDIFTSCPECENGGTGDPRQTGDVSGFRSFLIEEYNISNKAFSKINKKVKVGYYSMNYDVAKLIMDSETTKSLGGTVVIDHYVASPEQLASDSKKMASESGGEVVLGEFGVPIGDINGNMTEDQQAEWINKALEDLRNTPEVIGLNYWVGVGGSTQIWDESGKQRKAVEIIKKYYSLTI